MSNDYWCTHPDVFDAYNKKYSFKVDLACRENNKLCDIGLTEQRNSLNFPWHAVLSAAGGWGWLNPPYSDPLPWVIKAVEEQKKGASLVMLLNADTSVLWFRKAYETVSEIHFFMSNDVEPELRRTKAYKNGRIEFIHALTRQPVGQNNKPQFALVFDAKRLGTRITKYYELSQVTHEKKI